MTIRDKILLDIAEIRNPRVLYQILEFIHLLKPSISESSGNINKVLALAGGLCDENTAEIKTSVEDAFSHIEGEW